MKELVDFQKEFNDHLNSYDFSRNPKNLYQPISYILQLGGKRLRPTLTLIGAEIFGVESKKALDAALSVEVFHNFSLVHDDIMDDAPIRRGKKTVHEKWDVNTGILSGDAMLILAYKLFETYDPNTFQALAKLFSKTALEVCEGQQYDIDFETRDDVLIEEYLKMIEYKTAVLVGASLQMGAIVAGASEEDQHKIYEFGKNLGIAFQIQDDYLDTFGDQEKFGKQIGGDIIENKKTYLYLEALNLANSDDKEQLGHLFSLSPSDPAEKINSVISIYKQYNIPERTQIAIKEYTELAYNVLDEIAISSGHKKMLIAIGQGLMSRKV